MNTIVSRFLSFEEPLGAGLVKVAYFLLFAVLGVATVAAMIGGIVALFTVGVLDGLGQFFGAILWFVVGIVLLRVATEVVLAILSIDDQVTDGARTDGAMPLPRAGQGPRTDAGSNGTSRGYKTGVTEASKEENQRAPFTRSGGDGSVDTSVTEASKAQNQRAPFTQTSKNEKTDGDAAASASAASSGSSASSAAASSSSGAKSVSTAPAGKAETKPAAKPAAKPTPKKAAAKKTATPGGKGDGGKGGAASTPSAKKTAEAAKAATRPSASSDTAPKKASDEGGS